MCKGATEEVSVQRNWQNIGKRELQGQRGKPKMVLADTMLDQEVTPQCELCFCIEIAHGYIQGGGDSWDSSPSTSS